MTWPVAGTVRARARPMSTSDDRAGAGSRGPVATLTAAPTATSPAAGERSRLTVSDGDELHAEVTAAHGVRLRPAPPRGREECVEFVQIAFHAVRHGEHAHVRQGGHVGLA